MKQAIILSITVLIFCTSCTAKYVGKCYDGPELMNSEIGIIRFDDLNKTFNNQSVIPCKLDGVNVAMNKDDSIHVLPGSRKLLFGYDNSKHSLVSAHPEMVDFRARREEKNTDGASRRSKFVPHSIRLQRIVKNRHHQGTLVLPKVKNRHRITAVNLPAWPWQWSAGWRRQLMTRHKI